MTRYTARAFIFSGRSDPTWFVEEHQSKQLEEIWNNLKTSVTPTPTRPRLGYRGVSMVCGRKGEYTAIDGHVKRKIGSTVKWKKDEERLFEQLLLSTAPKGLLPDGILDT